MAIKNKTVKKILGGFMSAVLLFSASAAVIPAASGTVITASAASEVSLNKTSLSLGKEETFKLTANQTVKWRTSAPKILTVDQSGNVKAVGTGTAWITARNNTGNEKSCKITVKNAPSKVSISKTSLSLGVGETYTLSASLPDGSAAAKRTFRTSNSSIIKMTKTDWTGSFKALKAGTAWVTVRTYNGKETSCKITVKPAPTKITLTRGLLELEVGKTYTLGSNVNDGAACSKRTYRTSNSSIVKMTRTDWVGTFKAVKPGTAYVTVRTYNGKEASCKVIVKEKPSFNADSYLGNYKGKNRQGNSIVLALSKKNDEYIIGFESIYNAGRRISDGHWKGKITSDTLTVNAKDSWLNEYKYTFRFENGKIYFSQTMVKLNSSMWGAPDESNIVLNKSDTVIPDFIANYY